LLKGVESRIRPAKDFGVSETPKFICINRHIFEAI
jgi:hypothetical protein